MSWDHFDSNTVSFSGLYSGLDTSAIIKALVSNASGPINNLKSQESVLLAHEQLYNNIVTEVNALGSLTNSMVSPINFNQIAATSSNASVVTATSDGTAMMGNYSILVEALATAQRNYSNGFASSTTAGLAGVGSLSIQVGSATPTVINISGTMALQDIANTINDAGAGVTAGVVFDGASYELQITGNNTGLANALTLMETGIHLGLNDNLAQSANNAKITLDTLIAIERPSNVISDVISGVTLSLNNTSSTAQTLTLGVDSAAVATQVTNFVNAYNTLLQSINAASQYNGVIDPNRLVGDTTLRNLVLNLQNVVTLPISGDTGTYQALSQIGISTQKDGTLFLDTTTLQGAIANDYLSVSRLFTNDITSNTQGVAVGVNNVVSEYTDIQAGLLTLRDATIQKQIDNINNQMSVMWDNLTTYEDTLKRQYAQLESTMMQMSWQNSYFEQMRAHRLK